MALARQREHRTRPVRRADHRPIRVLVLIPTLDIGGAETDLVRTLPRIDRDRFDVKVCTFLARGELSSLLEQRGIEVVGPLVPTPYAIRQWLRRAFRQLSLLFGTRLLARLGPPFRRLRSLLRWLMPSSCAILIASIARVAFHPLRIVCRQLWRLCCVWEMAYLLNVLWLARPIAKYIRRSKTDVIHTVLPNSYLVGACASAMAGSRPLTMSRLSLNHYQRQYRLLGLIERRILHRSVTLAIGNSAAVLRDLRAEGIAPLKLRLVPNGIDIQDFGASLLPRATARRRLGVPDSALVLTVVANLHSYKGHRDLMTALALLPKQQVPDWLCLVVGADVTGELAALKYLCAQLGLSRNFRFLGSRQDVAAILSASDIHISASHEEGLPNNIIEAMCARLPVVATAVGGVPELVIDGKTGYLVSARDPQAMARALSALAQTAQRRRMFGEAGYKQILSHFNLEQNVRAMESVYASAAAFGRSGGCPVAPISNEIAGCQIRTAERHVEPGGTVSGSLPTKRTAYPDEPFL